MASNIHNIWGSLLLFVMVVSLGYVFWEPIQDYMGLTNDTTLMVIIGVACITWFTYALIPSPMNLAMGDDKGK